MIQPASSLVLDVTDLRFSYSEHHIDRRSSGVLLDEISFNVRKGECVALMGKSGIGKSTLLRLITGLVLPRARLGHKGVIQIGGTIATDMCRNVHLPPHKRNVGITFQKGVGLQEQRSVAENIEFPLRVCGKSISDVPLDLVQTFALWPAEEDSDRVEAKQRFWNSSVGQLSGGQKQRVALARCFSRFDRALYLLDEPLDGQDNPLRQQLIVNLRGLFKSRSDAGFIIVTHRMAEAFSLADRIVYFDTNDAGSVQIIAEGAPAGLYDCPPHISVARFLGDPAMNVVPVELLEKGDVPPSESYKLERLRQQTAVALLRPEQVVLGEAASDCDFVLQGWVVDVRRSGAERVLRIELTASRGSIFHAVAAQGYSPDEAVLVGWRWEHLHFFEQPSGTRLP